MITDRCPGDTTVVVGIWIIRVELDCRTKILQRFLSLAQLVLKNSTIDKCFQKLRINLYGLVEVSNGSFSVATLRLFACALVILLSSHLRISSSCQQKWRNY